MKARLHSSRMMVATFAAAIFVGMLIVWAIGLAGDDQFRCSVLDALFTATSAVCVTGLIVLDTGSEFSLVQQVVILVLIQLGGLGIMTFSNFILLARFGKLGIQGRAAIEETHGKLPAISPARLIEFIVAYTFILETVGAIILALRFAADYPVSRAIWLGLFHAVSAFCNAGFSLFSMSFEQYHADPVINLTIMALIVSGGAGYIVAADIGRWAVAFRDKSGRTLSLHSRVVIVTTVALIIAGALVFFFLETSRVDGSAGWNERCLHSVFLSVTSRTAGFNTVDTHGLSSATLLVVMLLMMIGGSPGSTAGGIKTTTFATLCALVWSRARNRPRTEIFKRSLPEEVVYKAAATCGAFLFMVSLAVTLLQITECPGGPYYENSRTLLDYMFEVVSALGTVGLSTGVTSTLSGAGRLIIIVCMFVGRLGPLIVAASFIGLQRRVEYTYPEEPIMVG